MDRKNAMIKVHDYVILKRNPIKRNSDKNLEDMKDQSLNNSDENKEDEKTKIKKMKDKKSPNKDQSLYPDLREFEDEEDLTEDDYENLSDSRQSSPENKLKKDKSSETSENRSYIIWIVIMSVSVIIALLFFSPLYTSSTNSFSAKNKVSENEIIHSLEKKFTQQPELSFRTIKASIKKILNTTNSEPTQPSIILLLSSKGADKVTNCFASELASSLSSNYLVINGIDLKSEESSIAMLKIDEKIKSECSNKKPAVVLMTNLDLIPASAALIFTSYFDHENAPFKSVFFISTILTVETIPKKSDSKMLDTLILNHLKQAWSSLHEDQLSALNSRLTVSVAAILPDNLPSNVKCQ